MKRSKNEKSGREVYGFGIDFFFSELRENYAQNIRKSVKCKVNKMNLHQ